MSQPSQNMAQQNLVNGIPSHVETIKQNVSSQGKAQYQFNGVNSAHSSRSSSPSIRFGQIPSSQLPPAKPIPQSQLPPSRSNFSTVTNKIEGLSLNTPNANPKFSTSTPNLQKSANFGQNSAFSPISSTVPMEKTPLDAKSVTNLDSVQLIHNTQDKNSQANINSNLTQSQQVFSNTTQTYLSRQFQTQQQSSTETSRQNNPQYGSFNNSQQVGSFPSGSNYSYQVNTLVHPLHNPVQQRLVNNAPSNNTSQQKPIGQMSSNSQMTGQTQAAYNAPPFHNQQRLSNQTSNVSQINQNFQSQQPQGPFNAFNDPSRVMPTGNVINSNLSINPPKYLSPDSQGGTSGQFPNKGITQINRSVSNLPQSGPTSNSSANYDNGPPLTSSSALGSHKATLHSNRYPNSAIANKQQPQQQNLMPHQQNTQPINTSQNAYQQNTYAAQQPYQNQYQGVTHAGFNKYWGTESHDLLQNPNILPQKKTEPPQIYLGQELLDQTNCSPDVFRCTMTKIPVNNSLLQKSRLPLGVLIHPFRDLSHLPVIQCNVIVRCRACRTYINPFVFFIDSKRWKCNLCYRINELPEEFQYDPISKTYGDPSRRPEIKSSTIEYIAPAEYMLRPPQPAVYLYLLDISRLAIESGYLHLFSNVLLEELKNIPGDARTQVGFIAYDSALHFYSLAEGINQPHEMTVLDIDDVFLPTPDNLLVNLKDRMELISELLSQLPTRYLNSFDNNSALGAALQVAYKMMSATGGRVTVFQASLPNVGPGALTAREDPSQRASAEVAYLNPINDFYKRLALECSGQQIAVDLFIVNSHYVDVATISGVSRFSGGCIHHFPLLKPSHSVLCENFKRCFRRYLTRKIGFEAVMRIRCTRGLSIHTFHGNFFVRSTDLLSLPNISPDTGFGMQVAIEESLADVQNVCFQAALLYTSSKGERRIRVHTLCLPVASILQDIIHSADQQCIIGLLSKMAVDRSMQSSLSDAREAFINVAIDILSSYKMSLNLGSSTSGLLVPNCLRLLPLYIAALLKHVAFRTGTSTRLDDRVKAMIDMKTKPLYQLIQQIYPDLYPIHNLEEQEHILNSEEESIPMPPVLQLSARSLENKGAFLMDVGDHIVILVCPNVCLEFLTDALGVVNYNAISDQMYEIPILDNVKNQKLHEFINYLNEDKPFTATIQVVRDNSSNRTVFFERLIEDRVENALSYHEFLQHLKTQVK